ncbi:DNA kinase/phosphatase Pnk1 [Rhodotorula toruloides]
MAMILRADARASSPRTSSAIGTADAKSRLGRTQEEGFDEAVKRINFVIDKKGLGDEAVYKKWRTKYLNCYPRDTSGNDTN